jgi:hypothetical protein
VVLTVAAAAVLWFGLVGKLVSFGANY